MYLDWGKHVDFAAVMSVLLALNQEGGYLTRSKGAAMHINS